MKTIGVIANLEKAGVADLLPRLSQLARTRDLKLVFDPECSGRVPKEETADCADFLTDVDVVITLGGDGTLLGAVRRMGARTKPILGVNMGKLGFLTGITQDEIVTALDAMAADELVTSPRRLQSCEYPSAQPAQAPTHAFALNDIVLSWGASSHIAHLEVTVDGQPVTTYTCDGLIIATPTGSTGHSLSAGGPVLHPESEALVISPICPHAMAIRPVVLHGNARVTVRLCDHSKTLVLACDGQAAGEMKPGDRIVVKPSDVTVNLLHLPGYQYWQVLRQKLHWRGSTLTHA
ncbi:MAG: NAD(+)/NADH kinase [Verrucomicrobia bacterium]|nr:NAD(+)/NADH kinase [Verrucomicrobiota bacterium]MCH8512749.1 NAD(+)/NADH kinase [Kiritimatiellia bacterium]